MRPDDELGRSTSACKEARERVERFGHVCVAKIPREHAPAEHRAVIVFGVLHESGILLGEEERVLREAPVPPDVLGRRSTQLDELLHDLPLARLGKAG